MPNYANLFRRHEKRNSNTTVNIAQKSPHRQRGGGGAYTIEHTWLQKAETTKQSWKPGG